MTAQPFAEGAEDLTPDWLSSVLSVTVRSVSVEAIGRGQTSATYRLRLDGDRVPSTMVAKLATGGYEARLRVRTAHRSEVGFYRTLAPTLRVPAPACWYAAVSGDGTRFTLLLEDLDPRRTIDQLCGCTPQQAEAAVTALARLHADSWNDPSLENIEFLIPMTRDRADFLADLSSTATEQFIHRYRGSLDPEDARTLQQVADVLADWLLTRPRPFALVHGDFRLENLLFASGTPDVVVVDWQTLSSGLPARDLSYFISTSFPVGLRRSVEIPLVRSYHSELLASGVGGYELEDCLDDYRVGHLQGPMITVLGSMTSSGDRSPAADEMFVSMAQRSCVAVRDLGSLD